MKRKTFYLSAEVITELKKRRLSYEDYDNTLRALLDLPLKESKQIKKIPSKEVKKRKRYDLAKLEIDQYKLIPCADANTREYYQLIEAMNKTESRHGMKFKVTWDMIGYAKVTRIF